MGSEKAPGPTRDRKTGSMRKLTARPATLRLLALLVASACGGRSALDDSTGFLPDDSDLVTSGGRTPSGGRPAFSSSGGRLFGNGGRSFGSGGRAAGGAFTTGGAFATGGESPAGGSPGCSFGAWGDGDNCQDWTICQPGEYVADQGSNVSDTVCAPCPPESYTAFPNETGCAYSGCAFSELVVTPSTQASAAVCAPDPDYHDLGLDYPIIGLSHRGARAYVALSGDDETDLRGYDAGKLAEVGAIPRPPSEWVSAFAPAPDGTTYLQGILQANAGLSHWLSAYANDLSSLWHSAIGTYESASSRSGVLATDSHWLSWQLSSKSSLTIFSSPHSAQMPAEISLNDVDTVTSIAADDQENIWLIGTFGGRLDLAHVVGLAGSLQFIEALPEAFFPSYVAVAPSGTAYVVGSREFESLTFELIEIDANGVLQRSWRYVSEPGMAIIPFGIGVDPGRAVYVGFNAWREEGALYSISVRNLLMLQVDLVSEAITTKSFIGPLNDSSGFMTVPSDGTVYVAGISSQSHFLRRVY